MTDPTGPLEAVAHAVEAVLSEHEPVWATSIDMLVRCDCGHGYDIAGYDYDGHNAHVATEIAAALELREETGLARLLANALQKHGVHLYGIDTDHLGTLLASELAGVSSWTSGSQER